MYLWQVAIRIIDHYNPVTKKTTTRHWCGGTIINKNWIVSAAPVERVNTLNTQIHDRSLSVISTGTAIKSDSVVRA